MMHWLWALLIVLVGNAALCAGLVLLLRVVGAVRRRH